MANFLDYPNAPQDLFMCLSKIYKCTMILDVGDKCQRDIHKMVLWRNCAIHTSNPTRKLYFSIFYGVFEHVKALKSNLLCTE